MNKVSLTLITFPFWFNWPGSLIKNYVLCECNGSVPEKPLWKRHIFSDVSFHYGSYGPQVFKVSHSQHWLNHFFSEPPARAAMGDAGSKMTKNKFCMMYLCRSLCRRGVFSDILFDYGSYGL